MAGQALATRGAVADRRWSKLGLYAGGRMADATHRDLSARGMHIMRA